MLAISMGVGRRLACVDQDGRIRSQPASLAVASGVCRSGWGTERGGDEGEDEGDRMNDEVIASHRGRGLS